MNRAKTELRDDIVDEELIGDIVQYLSDGRGVRKDIAESGRLNIDRPLPFLCVYRRPPGRPDKGTAHLILGEASYLIAPGDEQSEKNVRALVETVSTTLADKFGAFLIVEVWAAETDEATVRYSTESKARFRIFTDKTKETLPSTIETLEQRLESLRSRQEVEILAGRGFTPPGMKPLLDEETIRRSSCLVIGIEVSPIYRDAVSGDIHLSILADLRRKFSNALQQTFFEFVHVQTPERPSHPQMLGRRTLAEAVWKADAKLSALCDKFNYLMAVTPVNASEAFEEFKAKDFERDPVFHYRLLTIDPEDLKRQLYGISFEAIEDPTVAYLLRDKRIELDRQITLIEDRNTPNFLYESLQLFPPVEDELMDLAEEILRMPKISSEANGRLNASQVAEAARDEIRYYRDLYPEMSAAVDIRKDTPPGLMVLNGDLLIGEGTEISTERINGMLQHEVGTHVVTYFNGRAQPFKLLHSGLPGYEQLQEGLAVLTEYLVGGLSLGRLRTLAARVVAVRRLTLGHTFTEVFNEMCSDHNIGERSAFNIAMRVFRGGGLTKDAVYLRGLAEVLGYLREGGDIETLFVGKMGFEHLSIIRELQWREVLRPSPLLPRYMTFPETSERLERIRNNASIFDLV